MNTTDAAAKTTRAADPNAVDTNAVDTNPSGEPAGRRARGTDRRFWPGSDYTSHTVRAWARANGMGDQIPATGAFLPDHVVQAALAAGHGKADQLREAHR